MSNSNSASSNDEQVSANSVDDVFQQEGASADESADAAIDKLAEGISEVEQLRQELGEANERLLRVQAELENFRKRSRREIEDSQRYAALPLISDVLTVLDNLGRAIEAAEKDENASGLLEGVKMVQQHLQMILEQHHCTKIEAVGMPFDPNRHEAIQQEASSDVPAGSVTQVVRFGYQLHDRVVRPTQVLVSTGPAAETPQQD